MNLIKANREKILLELTLEEVKNISDVIFSADLSFDQIDQIPYEINEDQVDNLSKDFSSLLEQIRVSNNGKKSG